MGDWQNMLIFGDNLQGMKTLLEMKKAGKLCNADGTPGVRLVYIDPPFATKQGFPGKRRIKKLIRIKLQGAEFLEFVTKEACPYARSFLVKMAQFLYILDWKKGHYAKIILDEIFGEHKFNNEITWHYRKWSTKIKAFQKDHDTIFWYAKRASR